MSVTANTTRCPYCKEIINAEATRCRHCHADLTENKKKRSILARYNTFRIGFICGVVFTVILILLIYLQFYWNR